jgi:hypothetical protein
MVAMNEIAPNEEQIDNGLTTFPNQIRGKSLPLKTNIENTCNDSARSDFLPKLRKEKLENFKRNDNEGACPKCTQLEDALIKASIISNAEYLYEKIIKFSIPRKRYSEIKSVMRRSNDSSFLVIDSVSQSLVSVEPDIKR